MVSELVDQRRRFTDSPTRFVYLPHRSKARQITGDPQGTISTSRNPLFVMVLVLRFHHPSAQGCQRESHHHPPSLFLQLRLLHPCAPPSSPCFRLPLYFSHWFKLFLPLLSGGAQEGQVEDLPLSLSTLSFPLSLSSAATGTREGYHQDMLQVVIPDSHLFYHLDPNTSHTAHSLATTRSVKSRGVYGPR